jgi:hypothetical protein
MVEVDGMLRENGRQLHDMFIRKRCQISISTSVSYFTIIYDRPSIHSSGRTAGDPAALIPTRSLSRGARIWEYAYTA